MALLNSAERPDERATVSSALRTFDALKRGLNSTLDASGASKELKGRRDGSRASLEPVPSTATLERSIGQLPLPAPAHPSLLLLNAQLLTGLAISAFAKSLSLHLLENAGGIVPFVVAKAFL